MLKLFNLDLHISVIEDFKYIINHLYGDKIKIIDWSISGHAWVFNKQIANVEFINGNTWKNINDDNIEKFVTLYYDFLNQFDGFIVTHTPIFCLLYKKFNKPIIIINSTRYEQPFSFNNDLISWDKFDNEIKELYKNKKISIISNNKADYEYLKIATGIESIIIPSLCLYTKSTYNPSNNLFLIYNNHNISENNILKNKSILGGNYKWSDLYSYKGIIHIPYEVSTMSLFEQYSANVPLFIPSKEYLKTLIISGCRFQSRYNKIFGNYNYPDKLKIAFDDSTWIDFWLNNADYYDNDNMKYISYFNSNDELYDLIKTVDTNEISIKMKEHNKNRINTVYNQWKNIIDNLFNL